MAKSSKKRSPIKKAAGPKPTKKRSKKPSKRDAETKLSLKATHRAKTVLAQAEDCTNSLLSTFDSVRAGAHGALTDEQQDLLRAMLVFAAAGLDSALKELMKGSLPHLAMFELNVREKLADFAGRRLRDEHATQSESAAGYSFLATIITSPLPIYKVTEAYVNDLTGSSLQSPQELMKAAIALGFKPKSVGIDENELKPIFDARNKIIHELDVDLDSRAKRYQTPRNRVTIEKWSKKLLGIANDLVAEVERKLAAREPK
jgi:hypothetical protein